MFDFRLWLSLPRPKGVMLVCLSVFFCLAYLYWTFTVTTADDLSGALHEFLLTERSENSKHPQILIGGSSLSGMGFHVEELEKRTGMPVAKIALDGSHTGHMHDILESYPNECQHAKILFMEIALDREMIVQSNEEDKRLRDFRDQMEKKRSQIFDKSSNTDQTFDLFEFLRRNSMRRFLAVCNGSVRRLIKPRSQKPRGQESEQYYEKMWDSTGFRAVNEKERISLRHVAESVHKSREIAISQNLPQQNNKVLFHEKQTVESLYRVLDLCRERKIFVVVCTTPYWYGQLSVTQNDLLKPTNDRILSVLQDIDNRPDCAVIICRDFEEITSEGTDDDYLMDYGHMTRKGALLYTNWLVDRLLENPKTAAVFNPSKI